MDNVEYPVEQDKWLLCLKLAQSFWLNEEAKEKASVIFLRSELLPVWSVLDIFEELKASSDSF